MEIEYKRVLVLMGLLFFGVVGWRVWGWWQGRGVFLLGQEIVLSQPVRPIAFACLVDHQGETLLITKKTCEVSGLAVARAGDLITVWEESRVTVRPIEYSPLSPWWWLRQLERLHERCTQLLRRQLPEPIASLVAGVVIGEQAEMPPVLAAALRRTGTAHIVSASGYNVTVVMGLALAFSVRWWGRKRGLLLAGLLVWGYVLLAGASPPVVRAGLMGIVMMVGMWWGRDYWSGWSLVLVSGGMLLFQPWLLVSLSWQLSAAATTGVIWGSRSFNIPKQKPSLHHHIIWNKVLLSVSESFWLTLAATIMTAPLLLIAFGETSWLGLVVNPLVLWLIPPLMYLGGAMVTLGIVWPWFGILLGWVVTPLAWLLLSLIEWGGRITSGTIQMQINWWMVFGWWSLWLGWWGRKNST